MFSNLHGINAPAWLISSCLHEATGKLGCGTHSWLLQAA